MFVHFGSLIYSTCTYNNLTLIPRDSCSTPQARRGRVSQCIISITCRSDFICLQVFLLIGGYSHCWVYSSYLLPWLCITSVRLITRPAHPFSAPFDPFPILEVHALCRRVWLLCFTTRLRFPSRLPTSNSSPGTSHPSTQDSWQPGFNHCLTMFDQF